MVCYAQRLITMTCIALVAFLLLGKAVTHSLDVASLVVAVSAVVAGTAVAAAIAFVSFRSVRRRRALAGGCVACQFKCQHAMTEARPSRMWLVSTVDRAASGQIGQVGQTPAPAPARAHATTPPATPAVSAPLASQAPPAQQAQPPRHAVPLPMPHWPDSPLHAQPPVSVPQPRDPAEHRERVSARGH
jgi:hypothetical protein